MKRNVAVCLLAALLVVSGMAWASGAAETGGRVERFSVGSSSVGSASYSKLTIWGGHIGQKLDVDVIPEGTAGSAANISLTQAREIEMGNTMTNLAKEAWDGVGQFAGQRHDRIRAVLTLDSFALQFYAMDGRGIRSIRDLEGKHVNLSRAGSGTDTWARRVFEELGITPSRISNVGPGEANDLLRDGGLDVAAVMGSAHPSIIEMNATNDIVVFGVGDGTQAILRNHPDLFEVTIGGAYDGQTPFVTIGEVNIMIADKDFDADLVYQITKATYEDKAQLAVGYQGFSTIDPNDIRQAMIPLHRGAYRYYQEIGINIPAELRPID